MTKGYNKSYQLTVLLLVSTLILLISAFVLAMYFNRIEFGANFLLFVSFHKLTAMFVYDAIRPVFKGQPFLGRVILLAASPIICPAIIVVDIIYMVHMKTTKIKDRK